VSWWDTSGGSSEFVCRDPAKELLLVDIVGREKTIRPGDDGAFRVPLGPNPVYVVCR